MSKRLGLGLTAIGLVTVLMAVALARGGRARESFPAVAEVPQALPALQEVPRRSAPFTATIATDTVARVRIIGSGDEFGEIVSLWASGGILFVGDAQSSPHVAEVDLSTGEVLARVGRHGEGPGEFQSPSGMSRARGADRPAVWVHDFYNRRVSRVTLTSKEQLQIDSTFPLMVATSTQDPEILGDRVAAAGLFGEEAVVMFFDRAGRPLSKTGRPPFSMKDVGHGTGVRLLNRAGMAANRKGDRLAVAFYSANRLDVYSSEGAVLHSSEGPRSTNTSFYVENDRFFWKPGENQLAYTDLATTRGRIFLLFCGCTLGEEDQADRTRVHVFDWDGTFRRELVVPVPALRIAVDDEGRNLFTASEDPWPRVYQWSIPEDPTG